MKSKIFFLIIGNPIGYLYVGEDKSTKMEKYDDMEEKNENCRSNILELTRSDVIKCLREELAQGRDIDSMSTVTGVKGVQMAIDWVEISVLCTVVRVRIVESCCLFR